MTVKNASNSSSVRPPEFKEVGPAMVEDGNVGASRDAPSQASAEPEVGDKRAPLAQHEVLDQSIFAELVEILGAEKAVALVDEFGRNLAERFAEQDDSVALSKDAHAIVSSAGVIGFELLSSKAKALENACNDKSGFGDPLREFLVARRQVQDFIANGLVSKASALAQ